MKIDPIELFEYNKEWFDFKFIDYKFVMNQLERYESCDDKCIEHYKWGAYLYVLEHETFKESKRKKEFLQLIENDPNEYLGRGAVSNLIRKGNFDMSWKELFPESQIFKWKLLEKKLAHLMSSDVK